MQTENPRAASAEQKPDLISRLARAAFEAANRHGVAHGIVERGQFDWVSISPEDRRTAINIANGVVVELGRILLECRAADAMCTTDRLGGEYDFAKLVEAAASEIF
jgi:hypothetical protein